MRGTLAERLPAARRSRGVWIGALLFILAIAILGVAAALLGFTVTDAWAGHGGDKSRFGRGERREGTPFHWSGQVGRGKTVEIHGINGGVRVEPASGNAVTVDAKKTYEDSDPDEIEIEVNETPDGLIVCARYPKPSGELNDCGSRQQVRDNDVTVDFLVKLPAGVNLVAHTVNGDIEAVGLEGDVEAATVNGSVRVSTSGVATAETVNGSIDARLGRADWKDVLEFTTVNGRIRVVLPPDANAEVKGSTIHGSVSTDFPLDVVGRARHRRLTGTLGKGGRELRLSTVNGSIVLRSGAGASRESD